MEFLKFTNISKKIQKHFMKNFLKLLNYNAHIMSKYKNCCGIVIPFVVFTVLFGILFSLFSCGSSSSSTPVDKSLHLPDTFIFTNNNYSLSLDNLTDYFFSHSILIKSISYPDFANYDTNTALLTLNPTSDDLGEYQITFDIFNEEEVLLNEAFFYIDVFDTSLYKPSPADWREKNIYFLMVDRFNFPGAPTTKTFSGNVDESYGQEIHGGNIRGITEKLDYIKNLGFKAIWITPVLKNQGDYHGYGIWDFKKVDPIFGNMEDFQELVRQAHQRDMRVILDIVTNHSADLIGTKEGYYDWNSNGYSLRYHNENRKHRPAYLAKLDYFYNYGSITNWDDPVQILKGEFMGLDAFRTKNERVQQYLSYIYAWWILKTNIDGFRIDTVKHVHFEFWEYFLPYIRNITQQIGKDDFLMFGEVWDSSDEVLAKYTGNNNNPDVELFDSLTHFPMYNTIQDVFKKQEATDKISERVENLTHYASNSKNRLVTFIDNHDVSRFLNNYPNPATEYYPHLKLSYFFISTFPGIPCLYYGTEQGFDGGFDPNNPVDWHRENMWFGKWHSHPSSPSYGYSFNENHELYLFIKDVNEKIDENIWLKTAEFTELKSETTPGIYAFSRHVGDSEAIVVINNSNDTNNVNLNPEINNVYNSVYYNVFDISDTVVVSAEGKLPVTISSLDFKLYVSIY